MNLVGLNVLEVKNVLEIRPVLGINVGTHVLEFVAKMLNVMSSITYQVVHVLLIILEIHLPIVNQWKEKNYLQKILVIRHHAGQIVFAELQTILQFALVLKDIKDLLLHVDQNV